MARKGVAHKTISVILRLLEVSSAAIVLGILSRFTHLISIAGVHLNGRIIYAMVVAGISIIYSIFLCPPFDSLFLSFPFDFVVFVMWLVAACLLQTETKTHTCSANWYYNYWGYYWGRYWTVGPPGGVTIDGAGCAQWRTVLAFSFIAWFLYFASGVLGMYVFHNYIRLKDTVQSAKQHMRKVSHSSYPRNDHNMDSTIMEADQERVDPTEPRSEV